MTDATKPEKPPRPELKDRVSAWLKTTGFPLEYRTGRHFMNAGFSIGHSFYVPGEHQHNGLEVDVIAMWAPPSTSFSILVECKTIPPGTVWVALAPEFKPRGRWRSDGIIRSRLAQHLEQRYPSKFGGVDPTFTPRAGVQLKTMQENRPADPAKDEANGDPAFRAVQNLIAKALGHLQIAGYDKLPENPNVFTHETRPGLVLPMLVVEGDLAFAEWNPTRGDFDTFAVNDIAWLSWGGHTKWPLPFAQVALVKVEALANIANIFARWASKWTDAAYAANQAQQRGDAAE